VYKACQKSKNWEAEMKSILKWVLGLYVVVAIVTMILQVEPRYSMCSGAAGCGLSYVKGVVWSAIWPGYWAIQWDWV
jgi:hypothetical protein